MMKILQVFCFIFCFAIFANAQKSVLTGTIYDLGNSTIPKVKIIATDKKNNLTETFSDEKGNYSLTLKEGEYKVEFTTNGFRPTKIEGFKVGVGGNLKLDITMDIQEVSEYPPSISEIRKSDNLNGILTGKVYDPTGALIVNCKITAVNQKGEKFETYSNGEGVYSLKLPVKKITERKKLADFIEERYDISAEMRGFRVTTIKNFVFITSQFGKMQLDIGLELGVFID